MRGVTHRTVTGERTTPTPDRFRRVAGRFATGVTVTTSTAYGIPAGMTVNSFTTVSLEPTLLLVSLRTGCRVTYSAGSSGVFAVTVLAADQAEVAQWFASSGRPRGADEFAGARHHLDATTGCPLVSDGVAFFACTVCRLQPAGDHTLLIGEVRDCGTLRDVPPLLFLDGGYERSTPAMPVKRLR